MKPKLRLKEIEKEDFARFEKTKKFIANQYYKLALKDVKETIKTWSDNMTGNLDMAKYYNRKDINELLAELEAKEQIDRIWLF